MRRIRGRIILFFISVSMILCSCSELKGNKLINNKEEQQMLFRNGDEKYANKRFQDILSAIEKKDKNKIISMFSGNIRSNLREGDIDKLFDFIVGNVENGKKGVDQEFPRVLIAEKRAKQSIHIIIYTPLKKHISFL